MTFIAIIEAQEHLTHDIYCSNRSTRALNSGHLLQAQEHLTHDIYCNNRSTRALNS